MVSCARGQEGAQSLPELLKTSGSIWGGKVTFLAVYAAQPHTEGGLRAWKSSGSSEPLKSLLITFEIGQVSLFGEHHET